MTDLKVIKGGKSANPNSAKPVAPSVSLQPFSVLDHKRYLELMRDLNRDFAETLGLAISIIERDMKPQKPRRSRKPRVVRPT
jgi:hypothetical protein